MAPPRLDGKRPATSVGRPQDEGAQAKALLGCDIMDMVNDNSGVMQLILISCAVTENYLTQVQVFSSYRYQVGNERANQYAKYKYA